MIIAFIGDALTPRVLPERQRRILARGGKWVHRRGLEDAVIEAASRITEHFTLLFGIVLITT